MGKIVKILKINLFSLVGIPLLLLATALKLIAKSLEKIPVFIGLTIASMILLSMTSFSAAAESIGAILAVIIVACVLFGVVLLILFWVLSLISGAAALLYAMLIGCFNKLYNICYKGYLALFTVCESDYQLLSLNGKKVVNALCCPFYTILRGLGWLIVTIMSLSLPAAVVISVLFVLSSLLNLNGNVRKAFGMNLIRFMGKCQTSSVIGGIFIYVSVMAIIVTAILSFALEWYEWAQDLRLSSQEISEKIGNLLDRKLKLDDDAPQDWLDENQKYLRIVQEHQDRLSPLAQKVQELLSQRDDALLRSSWGTYIRNLRQLVDAFSAKGGVPSDRLKKLIPQIERLDKQRSDVQKLADRLALNLSDPAENTVFFAGCDTLEKLEKRYKALCKTYHPDEGGDTATFQKMQEEYKRLKAYYEKQA